MSRLTDLAARLAGDVADGWTVFHGDGCYGMDGDLLDGRWAPDEPYAYVRFSRKVDDVDSVVVLNIREPREGSWHPDLFEGLVVEGHVFVNGGCFTRRGIDCESVSLVSDPEKRYSHDYGDVPTMLAGEWERCATVVARKKTAEPVPGLPFSRQPEWFDQTETALLSGKSVSLHPHGFGTGYTLYHRLPRGSRARRSPELEQRLKISPIYVETFDAD